MRFLANDGHAGGEGGVGEHQEACPHPPHHSARPEPLSDGLAMKAMKLRLLSMADSGTRARREARERMRELGVHNRRVGSALWLHRPQEGSRGSSNGGGGAVHGGHAQDTRFPLTHFAEHVARVGVGKVGGDFGLLPGRV